MVVFSVILAGWTGIRLAGNISRWVWTEDKFVMMTQVEEILRREGKLGMAEFVRKDLRNQRWIQEIAFDDPVDALSAIVGSAVGLRGLQLGLPLGTRITQVLAARQLIRRWDQLGLTVFKLLTAPEDLLTDHVNDSLGLVTEGQGLVFEGAGLARDLWAMSHGDPISYLGIQSTGARIVAFAEGLISFFHRVEGKVEEVLPKKRKPAGPPRPLDWKQQLLLYDIHFTEFTEPSLPPPDSPLVVYPDAPGDLPDYLSYGILREMGLWPPPVAAQQPAQQAYTNVSRGSAIGVSDLRRILREIKR